MVERPPASFSTNQIRSLLNRSRSNRPVLWVVNTNWAFQRFCSGSFIISTRNLEMSGCNRRSISSRTRTRPASTAPGRSARQPPGPSEYPMIPRCGNPSPIVWQPRLLPPPRGRSDQSPPLLYPTVHHPPHLLGSPGASCPARPGPCGRPSREHPLSLGRPCRALSS